MIGIPARTVRLEIGEEKIVRRRTIRAAKGWKPAAARQRKVSAALKACAKLVLIADRGAMRDPDLLSD